MLGFSILSMVGCIDRCRVDYQVMKLSIICPFGYFDRFIELLASYRGQGNVPQGAPAVYAARKLRGLREIGFHKLQRVRRIAYFGVGANQGL